MFSSEGSLFSFNRLEALPSAPTSLCCLLLGLATPTLVLSAREIGMNEAGDEVAAALYDIGRIAKTPFLT